MRLNNLYFPHPSFYRPFLWGPAAAHHHQTAKSLGPSLWQQPSVGEVLEQMDTGKMYQSAVAFPQSRLLQVCVGFDEFPAGGNSVEGGVYMIPG